MLLVKKQDRLWHFCNNYHAFYVVTIKDSFFILTVNELLSYGVLIIFKLDLQVGYKHILVFLEDCFKISFYTHNGHYGWVGRFVIYLQLLFR
ncbi:hypothetical protein VIGAN_01185900 [Vigna angularis var. angularis]|uniref:Reverse transcriptase domain-containing protein n=1 Tax=Vigna angularis var. angularis TaxID=157739 RepID=A0A0S3R0Z3_PHAAN|nr:hypothetical protein VIGAN_01185900 [Vigna angularis var. angularis]